MKRLLRAHGPCDPVRPRQSAFTALCRAVAYQQLAGAAARTIWGRARESVDGAWTQERVLATPPERLRAAGLSAAKLASMRDLAEKSLDGTVKLRSLGRKSDDVVVEELTTVRGIGRWTAEMFLMFHLHRLDVWPTGDLGVRYGFARAFEMPEPPSARDLEPLGDPFRPYRSVVAWWMWREMDAPG
jgi:3-methyladenine DNA glycosylase/8-oxoguanine DNA glycosylase